MVSKKHMYFKTLSALLCTTLLVSCSNTVTNTGTSNVTGSAVINAGAVKSEMIVYDSSDYYSDWKNENPNYIKLNGTNADISGQGAEIKDGRITIVSAGVYVFSGKMDNGQIIVDVQDKETVRLVLNGAEIDCTDGAPIYVKNGEKVIVTLQEGTENIVTDGKDYASSASGDDGPDAAIFSKGNLSINGTGKLSVHANYKDGITSRDDLKITGGNINIISADDGLIGRDMVLINNGNFSIESTGDGIKSTNDTDGAKGFIAIEGGTFNIKAGDDGIHAETSILIKDGKIEIIKSYEGIESGLVTISGGETHVTSSDDGINISGGNDGSPADGRQGQDNFASQDNKLVINAGYVSVNASGDGLDSNGSIAMAGGTVVVSGPTSNGNGALDYNLEFEMTGGLLITAGSSGMAQAPSEQSTQYSIIMTYPQMQQAGTIVHLKDSAGNTISTFAPSKDYQTVVISSPELKKDMAYTLYSGGTSTGSQSDGLYQGGQYQGGTKVVDFTITSSVTWLNESGVTTARSSHQGGPGNPGFGGGQSRPERTKPEGN